MVFKPRNSIRPGLEGGSTTPEVAQNKTGYPATRQDRNIATQISPASSQGQADSRTQIYTYFTKPINPGEPTPILYNGDRQWVTVVLNLETAGPVAIGTASNISPVLSGKGQLLETGKATPFTVAKGTRLFVLSESVNRVKVTIEPLPWLEQFAGLLGSMAAKFGGLLGRK